MSEHNPDDYDLNIRKRTPDDFDIQVGKIEPQVEGVNKIELANTLYVKAFDALGKATAVATDLPTASATEKANLEIGFLNAAANLIKAAIKLENSDRKEKRPTATNGRTVSASPAPGKQS